ncbi:MAG TPA: hypothetical protein VLC09_16330 [Polyangiaceae bacterium]|nr:hypothetical protein [Polyangiaceae bacterium]
MADPKLKAELDALRTQLERLTQQLGSQGPAEQAPAKPEPAKPGAKPEAAAARGEGAPSPANSPLEEARKLAEELHGSELARHFGEFLSGLGQDLQDSKPRALITAFVAGFVAGKVLGK